jgi:hypothetical protein
LKNCGHDDLVVDDARPRERDVRGAIRIDGGHVRERARLEQLA